MSNSNLTTNKCPQFDNLPPELRKYLRVFNNNGCIPDDILPDIKISLLDAINNQELSSGYSPIYPNKIHYDINELIVWIGVNFPIYIEKLQLPGSRQSLFKGRPTINRRICLVCFDEFERYDFIWADDIHLKINDQKDVTIIKNYKEMLPLVINFKEAMQQKIGDLPYLGKKNDRGNLLLLEEEICRPDYNKIKADPTISLRDCICILLGIDDFPLIVSKESQLDTIANAQHKYLWENDFVVLPFAHEDDLFGNINNTIKYREGWRDVISFIGEFVSKINRESKAGFIEGFNYSTLAKGGNFSLNDIDQETHQYYYKPLSFLKWVKEAGYEIPKELSFIEKEDGTLIWGDEDIEDQILSHPESMIEEIENKIDSLLQKIRPEIDIFYEYLKQHVNKKGFGILDIEYESACEVFKVKKAELKNIQLSDIDKKFFGSEKPYREIKGGIIKNIVLKTYPEAKAHTSDFKLSAQDLYRRSNNLKKS